MHGSSSGIFALFLFVIDPAHFANIMRFMRHTLYLCGQMTQFCLDRHDAVLVFEFIYSVRVKAGRHEPVCLILFHY
ncbi:hypothetical protein C0674_09670 [Sporolactobacillus terrae]|uniref:Secreted protein n=1 Tax=Sporolactobacillus terrae TaxID=269673 RepID=A0ABX5Q8A5_9BACL|nr:hypothetical protein C0674_09670 [Sporolactobacillus terrae]QAA25843.1 hypothetical protein C0679_09650 [Sporolactobacillus terrae]